MILLQVLILNWKLYCSDAWSKRKITCMHIYYHYIPVKVFFLCVLQLKKTPYLGMSIDINFSVWFLIQTSFSIRARFYCVRKQPPYITRSASDPFLTLLMLNCDVRCPNWTRMTAYHRRCNRQRNNWYVRWEVYRWVIDWIYPVNDALLTADKACLSTRSRLSVSPIVYCLSKMLYLWYFACSRFDFKIRQNFSLDLKIDVHASNTWIEFI